MLTSNINSLLPVFIKDLALAGCVIQAGSADRVETLLTPADCAVYVEHNPAKDLYFLADVPEGMDMKRAADKDIPRKHYLYIDFDIRKTVQEKSGEKVSDAVVKEIGVGILHSLSTHPVLCHWRYGVFTGNGIHVYYIGKAVDIQSAENWRRGMQSLLKIAEQAVGMPPDYGCTNIARIGRIPGSNNNKGERAIPTEILEYKKEAMFNLGLIEEQGQMDAQKSAPEIKQSLAAGIPDGKRNTVLTSLAGSLRKRGLSEATILDGLRVFNEKECKPPLSEAEITRIAKSVSKYSASSETMSNDRSKPVTVCLSDVVAEEVSWLWKERIPKKKLTMIDGDPGTGKSWVSLAIACAVTRGVPLPGDEDDAYQGSPEKVLLLTAEDGAADTIRPRLEGMGADLARVTVMLGVQNAKGEERHLSLVNDLGAVDEVLAEGGYALVVIDPINAYLGADLDTHKDSALRSALTPLARLAERQGVAIICIRHLTKSPRGKAIYRGQGSIGFTGAARVVHLVAAHPSKRNESVIACIKNNLAPQPLSVGYEIKEGRFLWTGISDVPVEALLNSSGAGEGKQPAVDAAMTFLSKMLSVSEHTAAEVKDTAKAAGISEATLKRAREKLNVRARREGFGSNGRWVWAMPPSNEIKEAKEAHQTSIEELASKSDTPKEAQAK